MTLMIENILVHFGEAFTIEIQISAFVTFKVMTSGFKNFDT